MANKIVRTFKFPGSSDTYTVNADYLDGKDSSAFAQLDSGGKIPTSLLPSYPTTIASSTGTNELTLSYGGKYSLTAGGDSFVFTMPSDNNSSHGHSAGVGLIGSGSAGTSGTYTYKVNLVNETVASNAASYTAGGSSKFYAVQLDKNSKLGVYVPWTDTHYTTGITAGASGTTTNAVATNPYIKVKDNSTHRSQIRLLGSNGVTVKSDASGNVTVGANVVTVNVPTTGWTTDSTFGNKVTITVSGVTAGSNPVADVVLEGDSLDDNKTLLEQWSYISKITTAANSVTLYAFETVPTREFSILMKFI